MFSICVCLYQRGNTGKLGEFLYNDHPQESICSLTAKAAKGLTDDHILCVFGYTEDCIVLSNK